MPGFTYKSYNFINKDPIIDEVRTVYKESGANLTWIEENSGVAKATLKAWFFGKTKRPQAATVNAVLRSLGYKLEIVQFGHQVKIVPKMPEQEPISIRHVVQMNKYKRKRA
jgi:hypothetical protein